VKKTCNWKCHSCPEFLRQTHINARGSKHLKGHYLVKSLYGQQGPGFHLPFQLQDEFELSTNILSKFFMAGSCFTALINTLLLQKLYSLGGRKFALMAVNPIGCSPMVMANRRTRNGCIEGLNKAAHLFNAHLKSLVDVSKEQMPGSNVIFVNSYKMIRDIIKNPVSRGT